MDMSEEITWFGNMLNFGDILNMDGPLVETGPRLVLDNSVVGGWQYSQRGTVAEGSGEWLECGMRNAELGMNSIGVYSAFRIPHSAFCKSGEWRVKGEHWHGSSGQWSVASGQWPVNAK